MIQLILTLTSLLVEVIGIYRIILLIYFLLSWMPGAYQSKLGEILVRICEPYVGIFRRFVPPIGMISLAGLVAFFVLYLVESGVVAISSLLIRILISIG